jgi:hypothetical protein
MICLHSFCLEKTSNGYKELGSRVTGGRGWSKDARTRASKGEGDVGVIDSGHEREKGDGVRIVGGRRGRDQPQDTCANSEVKKPKKNASWEFRSPDLTLTKRTLYQLS